MTAFLEKLDFSSRLSKKSVFFRSKCVRKAISGRYPARLEEKGKNAATLDTLSQPAEAEEAGAVTSNSSFSEGKDT